MQGRHRSDGRSGVGAGASALAWALLAVGLAHAEGPRVASTIRDRGPVVLAADRIGTWADGDDHWVRLAGRATVLQGVEDLRAPEIVVRIRPLGDRRGRPSYRVDAFAEAAGADPSTPPEHRTIPATEHVELRQPFLGDQIYGFDGPPGGDPLVDRARARLDEASAARRAMPPAPGHVPPPSDPSPGRPSRDDSVARSVVLFDEPDRGGPVAEQGRPAPVPRGVASDVSVPPPPDDDAPFATPSPTQLRRDELAVPEPMFPEVPDFPEIPGIPDDPLDEEPADDVPTDDDVPAADDVPDAEGPANVEDIPALPPLPEPGIDEGAVAEEAPVAPPGSAIIPGTQRTINVLPLNPGISSFRKLATLSDGTETYVVNGGVQIVVEDPERGLFDITADNAVIWTRGIGGGQLGVGASSQSAAEPLEVYLEGNVTFLRDENEIVGPQDRQEYTAKRFYADLRTERFVALDAELEQYAPGLLAPIRTVADSFRQFNDFRRAPDGRILLDPDGRPELGLARIRARNAVTTGSRFANPSYRLDSRTVDFFELAEDDRRGPIRRRILDPVGAPTDDDVYLVDARSNLFFFGPLPFFYWPRFLTTTEDINPPLEQISFRTNNLFGQMILTDWDAFKLLGMKKPEFVDDWQLDIDYLSDRGPALGSGFGYFGEDFSSEILGYDLAPGITSNYFGYLDTWGIYDEGVDNIGGGLAVVPQVDADVRLFTRASVPSFEDFRGRFLFRHMQSLLPDDEDPLDDFRIQLEAAYISDRRFLEQYFKELHDSGLDQQTRFYAIRQWRNRAVTALAEANFHDWYTESQWYPRLDYYRLGDAPFGLGRFFTYYHRTGLNYATTHTAEEVANPFVFDFLPYDPTSLTSDSLSTGRLYTSHELDLPLQFRALRVVPYVQGQLVGWDDQYEQALPTLGFDPAVPEELLVRRREGATIGRAWGAFGMRADIALYRIFPGVESELFNVHGLAHKVDFYGDYRHAYSTQDVRRIGIQDDLDNNAYEFTRRYFAMSYFSERGLAAAYSPVLLTLRRNSSPITGTIDVQDRIETLRFGVNQRLQTKRGPIDDRLIVDWMTLDVWTTFFPEDERDNFGEPFGQTQFFYEWFIGDRTSIVSSGWFETFDIEVPDPSRPGEFVIDDGIDVISAGVNFNRPPRGTFYLGYSIIESGPVNSSALNTSAGYWLSPKWFGTAGGLYDFGEEMLLSTSFSITRIGADFLTTIGFSYTPLQDNYSFVFELVPRFSPRTKIGSAGGIPFRPDLRFAPTQ